MLSQNYLYLSKYVWVKIVQKTYLLPNKNIFGRFIKNLLILYSKGRIHLKFASPAGQPKTNFPYDAGWAVLNNLEYADFSGCYFYMRESSKQHDKFPNTLILLILHDVPCTK